MDYLLGSAITLATILCVSFLIRRFASNKVINTVKYSQSYVYELTRPMYDDDYTVEVSKSTQLTKHYDSLYIKTVITNNQAYWIKDNTLFVAPLNDEGMIDKESAIQVDTMSMDKIQLNEMVFIVEELTRGNGYDSWSSGKS